MLLVSRRPIGSSDLSVSPVALGLWPIAGVTTLGVEDRTSIATVVRARECGINHFDTAYSYGVNGRSDRVLRAALGGDYRDVVIASKVGMYFDEAGNRKMDTRPETLVQHVHQIIERLGVSRLDLLYLHCTDGITPIEYSAEALARLQSDGYARYIGVSNLDISQLERFKKIAKPIAVQLPLNMLQQDTYNSTRTFCESNGVSYIAYWALMKGVLAGGMSRDHELAKEDRRRTYEIYQGNAWQKTQDLLDRLRVISADCGWPIARLVIAWTMAQPGIASVLCGAKSPEQIEQTAIAMVEELPSDIARRIAQALAEHFS